MKEQVSIPIYPLQEKNKRGLEVIRVESFREGEASLQTAHRHDYYILVLQEKGSSKVMVDFKEVTIEGAAVFCIIPGQVHYGRAADNARAWFLAAETSWINELYRPVFQDTPDINTPIPIDPSELALLSKNIELLKEVYQKNDHEHFYHYTVRSLMDAFVSVFASFYYRKKQPGEQAHLRTATITRQFKSMLHQNFRVIKSPSEYAAALNISPSYLNEAVKQTTGHPLSYWIRQEVILEAKRMLFYTDQTVKEIAHDLGYEDDTYFIRLFGKVVYMSPLQFRRKYRK